ncbi:hypothetical protein G9A89_013972 [Geosiphon pyriformis]|nr:hypothetical protein G9A89_013972 [Geosiphon pyriformis]
MSSKKASKRVFYSPADGSFLQKKKIFLGNVKYSGDKKNIFLKSGSSASVYSNVESLSGNNEDVSMSGGFDGSLLDSAVNTPKAKHVNTSVNFGSPIGSPDFEMDEEVKPFPPPLMKKEDFFKDQWFWGGATTPSKFEEIIRSTFTSKESMRKAASLAEKEGIVINSNLKRQRVRSDQAVVIKKIPINTPKKMIVTTVSEFRDIKSIKIQLVGMWQKAVVEFAELGQTEQLASK